MNCRRPSTTWLAIAALLAHGAANADSDAMAAAGRPMIVMAGTMLYGAMLLVSIPFSLFLRGSIFKRIVLGLVAPVVGIALAWATVAWLQEMRLIDVDDTTFFFIAIAAIPVWGLLVWGAVSRGKAARLERSRVMYAEYLEREKIERKLNR